MNSIANNLSKLNIINNNSSRVISNNSTIILNSFNKLNINNSSSNNNNNNNSSLNNINRFYSTISPTSKPNFPMILLKAANKRKRPIHPSKTTFDKITTLADSGTLVSAESNVVRRIRDFQKEVDISSSLFGYPLYVAGLVSLKKGKYLAAEKFFRNSLSKYTEYDNTDIYKIETSNNLGLNLLRQGKTQEAEYYLFESYNLACKLEIFKILPHIFTNIGEYYKELCYFDRANYYHGVANSHLIAIQNKGLDLARCYLNRAQVFRLSNKIEEAESFINMGAKMLIQYFRERYTSSTPRHMDWSKLLLEIGHLYYAKGDYVNAKKKFISAKYHFDFMKNSNVPDSIMNMVNLAIIEHNHQSLSNEQSSEYIINLLNEVDPLVKELKSQTSSLNMSRVNSVIKILQKQHQSTKDIDNNNSNSNNNNNNNNNNNSSSNKNSKLLSKIKLFEPQHFQLTFIETNTPLFQPYSFN